MTTLNLFKHSTDAVAYQPGDIIFKEGDAGDFMYVLLEGEVEIVHNGQGIDRIEPGGMFGEMALLESSPRSATARAHTACRVVPINEKRFTFLVQQTPFFALHVMRSMSQRLRRRIP